MIKPADDDLIEAKIVIEKLDRVFDELMAEQIDEEAVLIGFCERTATAAASMIETDDANAVWARNQIALRLMQVCRSAIAHYSKPEN